MQCEMIQYTTELQKNLKVPEGVNVEAKNSIEEKIRTNYQNYTMSAKRFWLYMGFLTKNYEIWPKFFLTRLEIHFSPSISNIRFGHSAALSSLTHACLPPI